MSDYERIISEARTCRYCETHLPLGPRPVFSVHPKSKILIIGQAPGTKVHQTGIPWNDPSGNELRRWMDVDQETFYNSELFGIMPMGFCYPGRGKGGDLPPRPECAPIWHEKLCSEMPDIRLTLLIGQYAQKYYLGSSRKNTLTKTVESFEEYLPQFFPLVHPSPRNRMWQRRNPWFEDAVVPALREQVNEILRKSN
ncbi:uracil-DNA glycosylase family protein [Algoriphagus halophytocola]|uniref:Uracil-DNA glycosylase family protein n=1 Tax=Algoriphagus halophytocola TaxID=2991499 RepID=A0ABY6MH16_9BACT|nr:MULTISPECIES: uracil-DNA glycosylase family protein [unclassified Algoriphagus]UZD23072.1 uracil-DNA glycosylase family protein [Algoriphagus sp. TR-M5]WBL44364.1 uracil-DNA glycosylase family protein [Algoriphagus sp. TR-M9]